MSKINTMVTWIAFIIVPICIIFYLYSGRNKTVTRVVDGDTVYFDGRYKCRFELVDTPESAMNKKLNKDESICKSIPKYRFIEAGVLSKKYILNLLPVGAKALVYIKDVDQYGREVCKILLNNNENISIKLVEDGYAVPFFRFITTDDKNAWINSTMISKKEKHGLWKEYSDVMSCMLKDRLK